MHSEHKLKAKLQSYAPRVCGIRYPVFRSEPANIAKRRVSGWVMKKSQKGAWPQKPVKQAKAARACFRRFFAAPTPSAALASQPCKLPHSEKASQPKGQVPPGATLAHPVGMHLQTHRRSNNQKAKFSSRWNQEPDYSPHAASFCAYCIANLPASSVLK